jgi:CO/xanthine dehydrogenase Mo-binding subunit
MRTPGQLQENYPRELVFSEAAALAGVDAIEFRLRQTTDQRLIGALKAVRGRPTGRRVLHRIRNQARLVPRLFPGKASR